MKKIVFCLFAAFAAYVTFAGYAWFSSEINAILVSADFPSKYRTLESPVKLYGSFSGSYWTPPYAKVSYVTGQVTTENETTINVTTFADLNNYGKYDPSVSVAHYQDNCKSYVTDEFGQQYAFYDENVAAFYTKYESMNMNAVVVAFDQLKTKFQLWISSIRSQTGGLTYDASALAEKVKEIDNALDKASKQISDTVKNIEQEVANFNQSVQEAQQHLANVANTQIENAQDDINACVRDFTSFISDLESALESGEGWKEGAEGAYTKINDAVEDIVAAINKLEPYSSEPEVAQALSVLYIQRDTVKGLRSGLRSAIDNNDKSAAEGILGSAKQAGIIDSKKAMQRIDNAAKTYQSQMRMLNTLQKAAVGTVDYVNMIDAKICQLRYEFNKFVLDTIDNFHEIAAYLGSTNSVMYILTRRDVGEISGLTQEDLKRWGRVSFSDNIGGEWPIKPFDVDGYQYRSIFHLLNTGIYPVAIKLDRAEKMMQHYGFNEFDQDNTVGFIEVPETVGESDVITNVVARGLTAPKNWADGETLIVTNGKYKVVNNGLLWTWTGTNFINKIIQFGYSIKAGDQIADDASANGDGDYYVECKFANKSCTLKKAGFNAIPDSDTAAARMFVGTVSNGVQSVRIYTTPLVYMWSY